MKLIGLSGTNGSGKDTVASLLTDNFNFSYISLSDILREEAKKQNIQPTRQNLSNISSLWRKQFGEDFLVQKALKEYEFQIGVDKKGLAIGSIRNFKEALNIKNNKGFILWIDANVEIRYKRIQRNLMIRNHLDTDRISFKEFLKEEENEMIIHNHNQTLNMLEVKKIADRIIYNEGTKDQLLVKITDLIDELFPRVI